MTDIADTPAALPAKAPAPAAERSYVHYLHLFRGVAILQIVMLHAGRAVFNRGFDDPVPEHNLLFIANDVLFRNATLYFTLISGILFARLFAKRDFTIFFRARLVNVGVPYVVVSVTLTALFWAASLARGSAAAADWPELARTLGYNLLTGDAWNTLWYIPVILGLYLISPLLLALVRSKAGIPAVVILGLLPLVFSRTGTFPGPSTFVYFMGAYVLGLAIGLDLERCLDELARRKTALFVITSVSMAGLIVFYLHGIDMHGTTSLRESLFYLQRLALGALILLLLRHWETTSWRRLDWLLGTSATLAFGIYFLHGPVLRAVVTTLSPLMTASTLSALAVAVLSAFACGLALSLLLVAIARFIFGRHSRLIVGS